MLEKIKLALRLKSNAFDQEINDLILAGRLDLKTSGIKSELAESDDPLILRALVLYVQLHFGVQTIDHERVHKMYNSLVIHLGLSGDYLG